MNNKTTGQGEKQNQDNLIEYAGTKSELFSWGSSPEILAKDEKTIANSQVEAPSEEAPRLGEPEN